MIANEFTGAGEIINKTKRQHSIYMNNLEWMYLKELAKKYGSSISRLIFDHIKSLSKEFVTVEEQPKKEEQNNI